MAFQAFFDQVPSITLHDGLSQLLGASDDGLVTYEYADAVRLAGHSCPTVAGAWIMAVTGLKALYGDQTPERGNISVFMPEAEDEGVTGVIAQVLTLVTGAAANNGFHGLGGQHQRSHLLHYESGQGIRLRRNDTGATVEVQYNPAVVPGHPEQRQLIGAILNGVATDADTRRFGELWQDRVRRILTEHFTDPNMIRARVLN